MVHVFVRVYMEMLIFCSALPGSVNAHGT